MHGSSFPASHANATQAVVLEFECQNAYINCAGNGYCISNGTFNFACKCDSGYVTAGCAPNVQCCYKQKSRVLLFLISFFFGFTGAPYFMLGESGLGAGILLLFIGGILVAATSACFMETAAGGALACLGGSAILAAEAWHMALWIMFAAGTEHVKDSNGVAVGPW